MLEEVNATYTLCFSAFIFIFIFMFFFLQFKTCCHQILKVNPCRVETEIMHLAVHYVLCHLIPNQITVFFWKLCILAVHHNNASSNHRCFVYFLTTPVGLGGTAWPTSLLSSARVKPFLYFLTSSNWISILTEPVRPVGPYLRCPISTSWSDHSRFRAIKTLAI